MKKIIAEKLEFIYFTKVEGLPPEQVSGHPVRGRPSWELWQEVLSKSMEDMRWVLLSPLANMPLGLYLLHWDVSINLQNLDLKVENDTYTDEDFDKSILTQWTTVFCDNRDWSGYALHASQEPLYHLDVQRRKLEERLARGGFIKACPLCNTNFRINVAKIF
jgi:hypothetical protein